MMQRHVLLWIALAILGILSLFAGAFERAEAKHKAIDRKPHREEILDDSHFAETILKTKLP